MSDLAALFAAQAEVRWRKAESENASARLHTARTREAKAFLLSQHTPLAGLPVDRGVLRILFSFTEHHDKGRLERELREWGDKNAY